MSERPTPKLPHDNLLAYLLHTYPQMAYKYHEHDSLLEKNTDEDLSEEEKAHAWDAYENDVKMRNTFNVSNLYVLMHLSVCVSRFVHKFTVFIISNMLRWVLMARILECQIHMV